MLERLRRPMVVAAPVVLLLVLTGCGGGSGSTPVAKKGLEAVTITGKVGSEPKLAWNATMDAASTKTKTLVTGTGPVVAAGDTVLTQLVIADGRTREEAFSSYQKFQPQLVTLSSQVAPFLTQAVVGATTGSRVAVTSDAASIFPQGNSSTFGVGSKDGVLVVVDVLGVLRTKPSGKRESAPDWLPRLQYTKGHPSGLGFAGSPKPVGLFRKALLVTGRGPLIKKGQSIAVKYLGEVYGATQPYSENYSTDATGFSLDNVVPGWAKGLVGVPVGSRVVLEVPPALGYGSRGNAQAKIKGSDTVFFVIDILAAG